MTQRLRFRFLLLFPFIFSTGFMASETSHCNPKGKWATQIAPLTLSQERKVTINAYAPESFLKQHGERINELVKWADRSHCTKKPTEEDCAGLLGKGLNQKGNLDQIVVTPTMIYWFDMTRDAPLGMKTNIPPNGGGGLLRGAWPLHLDGAGKLNFADIRNGTNWAPNAFLPGATGSPNIQQGSGLSAFISPHSADDGVTASLENDPTAQIEKLGEVKGVEEALELKVSGNFTSSAPQTDPQLIGKPGTQGKISGVTTYRIARCDRRLDIGIEWKNTEGVRVGPVNNLVMAHNGLVNASDGLNSNKALDIEGDPKSQPVYRMRNDDSQALDYVGKRFNYADQETKLKQSRDKATHKVHAPEYRSRPSVEVEPPSYRLGNLTPEGKTLGTRTTVIPVSGFVSAGTIYDDHSLSDGTVAAFDLSLFNGNFHVSKDPRLGPLPLNQVPPYIAVEKDAQGAAQFYLKPRAQVRGEFTLRFDP